MTNNQRMQELEAELALIEQASQQHIEEVLTEDESKVTIKLALGTIRVDHKSEGDPAALKFMPRERKPGESLGEPAIKEFWCEPSNDPGAFVSGPS